MDLQTQHDPADARGGSDRRQPESGHADGHDRPRQRRRRPGRHGGDRARRHRRARHRLPVARTRRACSCSSIATRRPGALTERTRAGGMVVGVDGESAADDGAGLEPGRREGRRRGRGVGRRTASIPKGFTIGRVETAERGAGAVSRRSPCGRRSTSRASKKCWSCSCRRARDPGRRPAPGGQAGTAK